MPWEEAYEKAQNLNSPDEGFYLSYKVSLAGYHRAESDALHVPARILMQYQEACDTVSPCTSSGLNQRWNSFQTGCFPEVNDSSDGSSFLCSILCSLEWGSFIPHQGSRMEL